MNYFQKQIKFIIISILISIALCAAFWDDVGICHWSKRILSNSYCIIEYKIDNLHHPLAVAFDDTFLLTSTTNGTIEFWEIYKDKLISIKTLKTGLAKISALAISPDNKLVAVGDTNGDVMIIDWDLFKNNQLISGSNLMDTVHLRNETIQNLDFSLSAKFLAISYGTNPPNHTYIFDYETSKIIFETKGNGAIFAPYDNTFATIEKNNTVAIWQIDQQKSIHPISSATVTDTIQSIQFSPNKNPRHIVGITANSANTRIRSWDTQSGQNLASFNNNVGGLIWPSSPVFSADGRQLVLASALSNYEIEHWNINKQSRTYHYVLETEAEKRVLHATFSHNLELMFVITENKMLQLWDIASLNDK